MNDNNRTPDDDPVNIRVAWHAIQSSQGEGILPDEEIAEAIAILNSIYNEPFNYYFTLDTITRHENDDWFTFEPYEQATQNSDEQQMRSQTAVDPTHTYNVWSVLTLPDGNYIIRGWNYWPSDFPESSYWQGTTINYQNAVSPVLAHEAGHYFGLYHTFQDDCSSLNDYVEDTPAMHSDGTYNCNQSQDTCPDLDGNDPVTNIMNYSNCINDTLVFK